LWIYDSEGDVHIKIERKIRGASWAKVGSTIPGRLYDIKNKLVPFDGRKPHMTMPFQGTRISIVYFALRDRDGVKNTDSARLRACGFRLPPQGRKRKAAELG